MRYSRRNFLKGLGLSMVSLTASSCSVSMMSQTEKRPNVDILPSLIDICALTPPAKVDFDGHSFKPQLFRPQQQLPEPDEKIEKWLNKPKVA